MNLRIFIMALVVVLSSFSVAQAMQVVADSVTENSTPSLNSSGACVLDVSVTSDGSIANNNGYCPSTPVAASYEISYNFSLSFTDKMESIVIWANSGGIYNDGELRGFDLEVDYLDGGGAPATLVMNGIDIGNTTGPNDPKTVIFQQSDSPVELRAVSQIRISSLTGVSPEVAFRELVGVLVPPVLSLNKFASSPTIDENTNVTFVVTATETAGVNTHNIVITDTLPTGLTFVSADNGGVYDSGSNTVTWNVAGPLNFENTASAVVSFIASADEVSSDTLITNTASVVSDEVTTAVTDDETITVADVPDSTLSLSIAADPTVVNEDSDTTITITVSETAGTDSNNIMVTHILPLGVVPVSIANGGTYDLNTRTLTWTIAGPLNSGATASADVSFIARTPVVANNTDIDLTASVVSDEVTLPVNGSTTVTVSDVTANTFSTICDTTGTIAVTDTVVTNLQSDVLSFSNVMNGAVFQVTTSYNSGADGSGIFINHSGLAVSPTSLTLASSNGQPPSTGQFTASASGSIQFNVYLTPTPIHDSGARRQNWEITCQNPPIAELTASKSVAMYDPATQSTNTPGIFAIPGNDAVYTTTVTNIGDGPVDNDTLFLADRIADETTFYNADMDDGGPETDPVTFTQQNGAGLTFTYATDIAFSNSATSPTSFATCTYIPSAGYDINVTYICINPKGSFQSGNPDPSFAIAYRAQLR